MVSSEPGRTEIRPSSENTKMATASWPVTILSPVLRAKPTCSKSVLPEDATRFASPTETATLPTVLLAVLIAKLVKDCACANGCPISAKIAKTVRENR